MIMLRELQPGDPAAVGSYVLRGILGVGGMGRVYLGVSPAGRLAAVKVIRGDLAADREFLARFRREVAVARKVSSKYTAAVIDADTDGPTPWLATAYVAGPSLADAVAEHGPLPVDSVLRLATGLAEGLSAIHAAGVVHRDLKPANVLLAEDGPRVIDFGISLGAEASALTRTGLVVGSPGYMSPEQAEGREVGPASDIFSLGAILAFAATGTGPFGAGSTPALVYRVVHSPASLDQVPAEVAPLIGRCLAKDPRQRPTARELLGQAPAQPAAGWLPEPVTRTFLALPTMPGVPVPAPVSRTATMAQLAATPAPHVRSAEDRRPQRRAGRRLVLASVLTVFLAASAAGGVALAASGHPSSPEHAATAQTSAPAPRPSTSSAAPPTGTSAPATIQQSTAPPASPTPATSQTMPSTSPAPSTPAPASSSAPAATGSPAAQSPAAQSPAAQTSAP
jgi:serine/threonine protein kinase